MCSQVCHVLLHQIYLNWFLDYEDIRRLIFAIDGYRWMITPEMLQQTPGVWYVDTRLFNTTWEPGLTLKITSFTSKCLYWNTEREIWTTDGCQVSLFTWIKSDERGFVTFSACTVMFWQHQQLHVRK